MSNKDPYYDFIGEFKHRLVSLNPGSYKELEKKCEEITSIAASFGWEYVGIKYKGLYNSPHFQFNKENTKMLVDPLHCLDLVLSGDNYSHQYSAHIYPSGKFKQNQTGGFFLFEMDGGGVLSIIDEFNKKTLKKAEKFIKKNRI